MRELQTTSGLFRKIQHVQGLAGTSLYPGGAPNCSQAAPLSVVRPITLMMGGTGQLMCSPTSLHMITSNFGGWAGACRQRRPHGLLADCCPPSLGGGLAPLASPVWISGSTLKNFQQRKLVLSTDLGANRPLACHINFPM